MNERAAAEEHLRVIRSLMERATVYRAISAPTALVGGALTLLTSAVLLMTNSPAGSVLANPGAAGRFIAIWIAVMMATLLANALFIWRKTQSEGSPFFTSGLRLAIWSAAPVLMVTVVLTFLFWRNDEPAESLPMLAVVWITCYGLALLSTSSFAPASLRITGWAFLATGVGCMLLFMPLFNTNAARWSLLLMALTFGLYNVIYGVATWPIKRDGA